MENLNFVLIPWLTPSHMNPMIDIACLLAGRRHGTVSVITTPGNAARIKPTIDRLSGSGLPIQFILVDFPAAGTGLPEGCESVDRVPSIALLTNFLHATKLLKDPVAALLRRMNPAPSCIISGVGHGWTVDTAREFGVPRIVFQGFSCFSLLSINNLHHYKSHEAVSSDAELFPLPGLLDKIHIARRQLPQEFRSTQYKETDEEVRYSNSMADGLLVNSFDELEPGYANHLEEASGKKAWMIGPFSLSTEGTRDAAERGNESRCLSWLDSKSPKSVVYVCFGTTGAFGTAQLVELGAGLLASGRPFIWVISAAKKPSEEAERWLSEKFGDSSDDRCCLLIRGWAPQVAILSHAAVGGFVTHCGWNSTLEGICAGVPMVTWPLFSEQFLNEKLVVDVLGIGVPVGAETTTDWGAAEKGEAAVRREEVALAVGRLMDGGEVGEERRRRAEQLGLKAKLAMEKGGSSYLNLTSFIQYVLNHVGQ